MSIRTCHWEGQFNLFHAPRGICKRLANVFILDIRIGGKNLCIGMASGDETYDRTDGDTHST